MKPVSLSTLLLSALLPITQAASLRQITTPFGPNPRNLTFHLLVPDTLPPNPAILVNPHWCHGTAQAAYAGSQWATLAARHGFIVIYPGHSPASSDQCWDVSSKETLTHDGGGDSLGIVSMVRWTLARHGADARRVFVTGVSSGGMMTQVLLGAYPDVFAAGAAFAGVPFGCYAPAGRDNAGVYGHWSGECASGEVVKTPVEWAALVDAAWPGYEGWRPKVQIFHGTRDEVVSYTNHGEGVKLWTEVLGLGSTPVRVVSNTPLRGWTKSVYGESGWLEAYSAEGVPHDIKVQEDTVMGFFQLNCTSGCFSWGRGGPNVSITTLPGSTTSSRTTTTSTSASSPSITAIPTTEAATAFVAAAAEAAAEQAL
ncbi:PHB depolymerase family esterase [Madurella fahalii]|uniref:Carboxylic ester hydrolase n=1 Tax=Madurella fahalii TaxID=1157608 RepID=A0ABQ0GKJ9_9PEZI